MIQDESDDCLGFKMTSEFSRKVFVVCDGGGEIVFVQGNSQILQMKSSQLLHKNFFCLGFTILSLLKLSKSTIFNSQSGGQSKARQFNLQLLNRQNIWSYNAKKWHSQIDELIKVISVKCCPVGVLFNKGDIVKRKSCIEQKETQQKEERLYLLQIEEARNVVGRARRQDYESVRLKLINENTITI